RSAIPSERARSLEHRREEGFPRTRERSCIIESGGRGVRGGHCVIPLTTRGAERPTIAGASFPRHPAAGGGAPKGDLGMREKFGARLAIAAIAALALAWVACGQGESTAAKKSDQAADAAQGAAEEGGEAAGAAGDGAESAASDAAAGAEAARARG